MKTIPNKEEKFEYLVQKYGYDCPIAKKYGKICRVNVLHHRLSDTKTNCKRFPLFIQSTLNLRPVNNDWHINNPGFDKLIPSTRIEKIEERLRKYQSLSDRVNLNLSSTF